MTESGGQDANMKEHRKPMRQIDLDATNWVTVDDFYNALLHALGAPYRHGHNINALVDSMIWGQVNELDPPYRICIHGVAKLPMEVRDHIELAKNTLLEARADNDVEMQFETVA